MGSSFGNQSVDLRLGQSSALGCFSFHADRTETNSDTTVTGTNKGLSLKFFAPFTYKSDFA